MHELSLRELLMLVIFHRWDELSSGLPLHAAVAEALAFWLEVFVVDHFAELGVEMKIVRELKY
jgi:hypothetical protein